MERRDWQDLMFSAVWTNKGAEYSDVVAEFRLYCINGYTANEAGDYVVPMYSHKDGNSSLDDTTALEDAEVFVTWTIKWDGCSHMHPAAYWHLCGRQDLDNFLGALQRTWDWAKELGMDRL